MAKPSTLLKATLRERHWQKYATFCKQYDHAARSIDGALTGSWPSRAQFARWLAGEMKGLPQPDHCRVLEAMFPGLAVAQLFTHDVPPQPPVSDVGRVPVPPPRAVGPQDGSAEDFGPSRVRVAGEDANLNEEIVMATEESARFVRRRRGAVDQDVLDQLNADVRQLAIDFLARPAYVMFRPLSSLRSEVFELLDERQRPPVLPGLYRVAGQLCALLAHASADLGQAYAAETHTRTAWLCADLAEDNQLRAYVRWVQSNVAYWNGDYRRAAEFAHAGQRFATTGTSLLRLASQEARAYAAAADHREVERSLAVASAARAHDVEAVDDPGGVFRFDPGKAAYYASEVRLALGGNNNNRKAATEAERSLGLFAVQPETDCCPEFIAAAQLDLVAAHLALRDPDAAEEHLRPVLRLPSENRTLPVVQRMANTDRALAGASFAGSGLASDLRENIALFRAYPAARELPALPG